MITEYLGAVLRRAGLCLAACLAAGAATAQCTTPPLPAPSTTPVDLGFGPRDRARVVSTGNFDGIGGSETAVTGDGLPIIRVDSPGAGNVTVRGNSDSFTYTFPASGSYAVVFPFAPGTDGGGNPRTVFRVTTADGPFSGGTATWGGTLTVVTAIDDGSDIEVCIEAEEPATVQRAARVSNRLALAEIGTWRQRNERAVGDGTFLWARAFGGGGDATGSRIGVQAGLGRAFGWGRGSVFFSYAEATSTAAGQTASATHVGAGATATVALAGGGYLDFVARLADVTRSTATDAGTASTSGLGYAVSAEAGLATFAAGPVVLQPELQLVLTGASLPAFDLPDAGTATYGAGPAIFARGGLAAVPSAGGPFWGRIDVWSELQSGTAVTVDGGLTGDLEALPGETWVDLTAGLGTPGAQGLGASVTARVGPEGTAFLAEARLTIPF